ncbi:MAG: helix-turn-helix transcriptional regulator [Lentisphaeria bacterium]
MLFEEKVQSLLTDLVDFGLCFQASSSHPENQLFGMVQPYYPAESHSEHVELIHLCSGEAAIQINDAWFPLTAGQAQIFLLNTFHSEHFLRAEQSYELLWLSLNPFTINLHTTNYNPGRGYGQSSLRQSLHPLRMEALWDCIKAPMPERPRFLSLLLECLDTCLKSAEDSSVNYHADAVELVRRYLEDYYCRQIQLSDLAAMSHYSAGHLSAIFRAAVKMPIYEYLCQVRLQHAAELLRCGRRRIKDVAAAVGFRDQLYFCRYFRKKFGVSPRQYSEACQKS